MGIEILDIVVIAIVAIIGVIALALLRKVEPTEKKQYKKYSSFLIVGGSWSIIGFILGNLYRGRGIFDNTLLTVGIIFLFAGGIGVISEYFRKDRKNYAS